MCFSSFLSWIKSFSATECADTLKKVDGLFEIFFRKTSLRTTSLLMKEIVFVFLDCVMAVGLWWAHCLTVKILYDSLIIIVVLFNSSFFTASHHWKNQKFLLDSFILIVIVIWWKDFLKVIECISCNRILSWGNKFFIRIWFDAVDQVIFVTLHIILLKNLTFSLFSAYFGKDIRTFDIRLHCSYFQGHCEKSSLFLKF